MCDLYGGTFDIEAVYVIIFEDNIGTTKHVTNVSLKQCLKNSAILCSCEDPQIRTLLSPVGLSIVLRHRALRLS